MASLGPTCVWRISADVIRALDSRFGDPIDAYVNGSQTWLRDDGPAGLPLEWRLHPVPSWAAPPGVSVHDVFTTVALSVAEKAGGDSLVTDVWDGLEAFPAYGDETEPAPLAAAVTAALGLTPDGVGLVDHDGIADAWERSGGSLSIVDALLEQLRTS
ncbi:MAG: hypothetical protein WKF43_04160 [Acidimicrobiales bacterium]